MRQTKSTLITIIVLLVFFAPLAVYGAMNQNKEIEVPSNINKEFYYEGNLYFYDEVTNELLGTYTCKTDQCGYPVGIIDDDKYSIDYYQGGEEKEIKIYNSDYALIQDEDKIILYSLSLKRELLQFEALKNYHTSLENDLILAKKDSKWGVLSLVNMSSVIDYSYDFIGINDKIEDNVLQIDRYIVKKEEEWFILNTDGIIISSAIEEEIKAANELYIICENSVYDYESNKKLEFMNIKDTYIIGDYVIIIDDQNVLSVYSDLDSMSLANYSLGEYSDLEFEINEGSLSVYDKENLVTEIAIN